jgi:hypothetical protein
VRKAHLTPPDLNGGISLPYLGCFSAFWGQYCVYSCLNDSAEQRHELGFKSVRTPSRLEYRRRQHLPISATVQPCLHMQLYHTCWDMLCIHLPLPVCHKDEGGTVQPKEDASPHLLWLQLLECLSGIHVHLALQI